MVGRGMLNPALSLNGKLSIVAIRPLHNTHPFDLFKREGFNRLLFVAHQTQTPNATAIREGDVLAIRGELPTGGFVFHRTVIMLEAGIALLAGLVVLARLIEAGNGRPGPIRCHLPSLGVEQGGERVLSSKYRTVALQVIFRDGAPIHPQPQTFVANELHNANRLINGLVLRLFAVQFVLVDQHGSRLLLVEAAKRLFLLSGRKAEAVAQQSSQGGTRRWSATDLRLRVLPEPDQRHCLARSQSRLPP